MSGARLLKPQCIVKLSLLEEEHWAVLAWIDVDCRLYRMCFRDPASLKQHVMDPVPSKKNMKGTAICQSDQIPFWVKITCVKQ